MDTLKRIPLEKIVKTQFVLRTDADIDKDFLESIRRGVVEPIVVRQKEDDGTYEVVCGMRRLEGLRQIGEKTTLCIVRNLKDKEAAIMAMQENLHRKDVAPMDYADAIIVLMETYLMSQEEVAQVLCLSESTVSNLLRVHREAIFRGKVRTKDISFQVALELLTMKPKAADPRQLSDWESFVDKTKGKSVHETRRMMAKSPSRGRLREAKCYLCSEHSTVVSMVQICGDCAGKLKPAETLFKPIIKSD